MKTTILGARREVCLLCTQAIHWNHSSALARTNRSTCGIGPSPLAFDSQRRGQVVKQSDGDCGSQDLPQTNELISLSLRCVYGNVPLEGVIRPVADLGPSTIERACPSRSSRYWKDF